MNFLSIRRTNILILFSSIFLFSAYVFLGHADSSAASSGGNFAGSRVTGGADIYANNCSRCHGTDGRAQTPKGRQVGAVDLTSDEWTPNEPRDIRLVTKGRGSMPSFKNRLTADEITSVVRYIVRFKS